MVRTKGQIRGAKSKGKSFERDIEASLKQIYPDIHLTHEVGYVQGLDLISHEHKIAVECKRHKGFSWNELIKIHTLLNSRVDNTNIIDSTTYYCLVIFQSNRQPPLVFFRDRNATIYYIMDFKDYFHVPFIKHTPAKMVKNGGENDDN